MIPKMKIIYLPISLKIQRYWMLGFIEKFKKQNQNKSNLLEKKITIEKFHLALTVAYLKLGFIIIQKPVYALQIVWEKTSHAVRKIIRVTCNILGKQLEQV